MGSAGGAAIVSASASCASQLGVLTIAAGLFTGPRAVSDGGIVHVGDIDHGALTQARPPGQVPGVPAVGCGAVTGLWGHA